MIRLEITTEGAFCEIHEDGVSRWRKVNTRDLIRVLNESVGIPRKTERVISPMLPISTIGYMPTVGNISQYILWLYQPAKSIELLYESRSFPNVGIPAAVYKFSVNNGMLITTDIWAVTEVVSPNTELYHFPVFNIGHDGHLCMGSNRLPILEPYELSRVPDMITMMPSTNAYQSHNKSGLERDSLYKELQGKKFPNKWLTPTNKKLGDKIKEG